MDKDFPGGDYLNEVLEYCALGDLRSVYQEEKLDSAAILRYFT